jgi:hypothetical protein
LSLAKGDYYCIEVQDNNNVLAKHIVKADQKYCSCLEWQHTGKPCQHGLVVIIAQPFRDVGMENFVNDYFSVEKFKKVYARRVEQLSDQSFWPQVEIEADVGAPLLKISVGRQRKNIIKGCLEGGSGKKMDANESEKAKKLVREKFRCPNYGELDHRKSSPKCPLNGTKKRQVFHISLLCLFFVGIYVIPFVMCRKRKARKNTTKGWFPKEALLQLLNNPPLQRLNIPHISLLMLHCLHMKTLVILHHHRLQDTRNELFSRN